MSIESNLTPVEVDENFNELEQRLDFQDEDRIPVVPLWFQGIVCALIVPAALYGLIKFISWIIVPELGG